MNPDMYAVVCVTQSSYDLILHYRAVRYPALAMFILCLSSYALVNLFFTMERSRECPHHKADGFGCPGLSVEG